MNVKNLLQTPRKLPFSDSTNKTSEQLQSAKKQLNVPNEKIQQEASSSQISREQNQLSQFDDFDFSQHTLPADKNCFCCGPDRKSKLQPFFILFLSINLFFISADGEIWGEALAMSDEFIDRLVNHPDVIEEELSFVEPWSLPTIPEAPEFLDDQIEVPTLVLPSDFDDVSPFVTSLNRSYYTSAVDFSDSVNLDSSLTIPEYDFDFSDEVESADASAADSSDADDSIIGDW